MQLEYGNTLTIHQIMPLHHQVKVKFGSQWVDRVGWPCKYGWLIADKGFETMTLFRSKRVKEVKSPLDARKQK